VYIYVLIKKYSYLGFMLGKFNNRSRSTEWSLENFATIEKKMFI